MQVIYEDNHIIVVSKESGEIVQGDKTGDTPLSETVKAYIKEKYAKIIDIFGKSCTKNESFDGRCVMGKNIFLIFALVTQKRWNYDSIS